MGQPDITVERLDSPAGVELLAELDADLSRRYGDDEEVDAPVEAFVPPQGLFVVLRVDGRPLACAGIRRIDDRTAELKRMYVRPEARGKGFARLLLRRLEAAAAEARYVQMWLETGLAQPEAMALYVAEGYEPIPPYGQFAGEPQSRCFAKPLAAAPSSPSSRAPLS